MSQVQFITLMEWKCKIEGGIIFKKKSPYWALPRPIFFVARFWKGNIEEEKMTSQFAKVVNCDIDNKLNLKEGMWKTFARMTNCEQWTVPMYVAGVWEPTGNWTFIVVWIAGYKEKREREECILFEVPESIIKQVVKQVRIVPARWAIGPLLSSLDKRAGSREFVVLFRC